MRLLNKLLSCEAAQVGKSLQFEHFYPKCFTFEGQVASAGVEPIIPDYIYIYIIMFVPLLLDFCLVSLDFFSNQETMFNLTHKNLLQETEETKHQEAENTVS